MGQSVNQRIKINMQIAIVGLGRMGKNIAFHLLDQGVEVIAYNRSPQKTQEVIQKGGIGVSSLAEIPHKFTKQVVVMIFIPAGSPMDEVLFGVRGSNQSVERDNTREQVQKGLIDILPSDSIVIDGGNSFYQDSQKRFRQFKEKGINFLDMGTSGGHEGARNGACLMVGGEEYIYQQVEPLLKKIAQPGGLGYFGPTGSGHFVKMVHNAIEYGMMGAIGEGLNLVRSKQIAVDSNKFKIDLAKLAKVWANGSIISGLLMDKTATALARDPELNTINGEVPRGETEGEIEWLEKTGILQPVIQSARRERVETRNKPSFIGKVIAALRREFGGHTVNVR
jgi:6-phosphogluconate dehydrogenase